MLAVDTNILVRLLTADDPDQTARAKIVLSKTVWISHTVFLETAWVLSYFYSFDDAAICEAFRRLLGLGDVHAQDAATIHSAILLCGQGVQFADALHLCCRPAGVTFVSFDESLLKRARRAGLKDVSRP
jgi:predicted nucleic-acid-binding protein